MLTRKQHELLLYISDRLSETGVSPSFEEMKEALDLKSKSGVHRLISASRARFHPPAAQPGAGIEVPRMPDTRGAAVAEPRGGYASPPRAASDILDIPLHGRIAGTPIEALQGTDALPRPRRLGQASIMRRRCPAIRWSRKAFSTAITRAHPPPGHRPRRGDRGGAGQRGGSDAEDLPPRGRIVRLDPASRQYDPQRCARAGPDRGRLAGLLRRY